MAKTLEDGRDHLAVNPKGAVPALKVGGGEILTENAVILHKWPSDLAGRPAAREKLGCRELEWIGFISTGLHKGFGRLRLSITPNGF